MGLFEHVLPPIPRDSHHFRVKSMLQLRFWVNISILNGVGTAFRFDTLEVTCFPFDDAETSLHVELGATGIWSPFGDAPTRITHFYSFLVWDVWACQLPLFNYFEKKSLQLHSITLLMHATLVPEQPQVPLHSSVVGIGPIGPRTSICMNVCECILMYFEF